MRARVNWASTAGSATQAVADAIMKSRRYPEQGYRSCLGLIRLGDRYGQQRLESACARALKFQACSYKTVKSILESGLDRQPDLDPGSAPQSLLHENIRGADYFQETEEDRHAN